MVALDLNVIGNDQKGGHEDEDPCINLAKTWTTATLASKYTPSTPASKHTDFEYEGRKTGNYRRTRDLDVIWRHPTSSASLFVGNLATATNREVLKEFQIMHIVTCTQDVKAESVALYKEMGVARFHYAIVKWSLLTSKRPEVIARFFAPLLGWVSDALEAGHSVLIHCLAGAHRAGTAGVACLMYFKQLDAVVATREAQAIRECIDPAVNDCGLDKLLRKLQRAQKLGLLQPAIEEARQWGFEQAWAYLFTFRAQFVRCCCCKRPRLKPRIGRVAPQMAPSSVKIPTDNEINKNGTTVCKVEEHSSTGSLTTDTSASTLK